MQKLRTLLKSSLVQLLLSIVMAFYLSSILSAPTISTFYTISCCFIEVLLFLLPLIVFVYIFHALVNSQRKSLRLILLIFAGVTVSNCVAIMTGYFFSQFALPLIHLGESNDFIDSMQSRVAPLFSLHLPKMLGTEIALALGLLFGIAMSFLKEGMRFKIQVHQISILLNRAVSQFLQKVFIPFLPLYVFGFCLKLGYDGALVILFQQFGKVFLISLGLVVAYQLLLYRLGAGGWRKAFQNIRTMMPAGITGFSTMSSAATLPVTLQCVKKMTKEDHFSDLVIPSTANIHMLGDDLSITVTAMALLSIFGIPWPDFMHFLPYVFAFSMAKLSCVGVPGASVFVVLPALEQYLGFTPEMVTVLTTIYILQDPFGTASNVWGNGAFASIVHRIAHINDAKNMASLKD